MKIAVIADVHSARHGNNDQRFAECRRALEWAYRAARDAGCGTMIVAGDLFHDRTRIDVSVYSETYSTLKKAIVETGIETFFLVGNHDMYMREERRVNSLTPLGSLGTVVTEPRTVEGIGWSVDLLPYCEGLALGKKALADSFQKPSKLLIAHVAVEGALLNCWGTRASENDLVDSGGIEDALSLADKEVFDKWNIVLCGHYHVPQVVNAMSPRIEYVGSLLQHNFGEVGSQNRFVVVDTDDWSLRSVVNDVSPKFVRIDVSSEDDRSLERVGNHYVRLVFPPMTATSVIDEARKKAIKHGALSVDCREAKKTALSPRDRADMEQVVERLRHVANDPEALVVEYVSVGPESWNASTKEELEVFAALDAKELSSTGKEIVAAAKKDSQPAICHGTVSLKRITAKNFMSVGEPGIDVRVDSLDKIVVVKGENADVESDGSTNGAGKSAVLVEAPAWCVFGETFRKLKKQQIVRSTARGKCEVNVEINDIVVSRGIKPDFLRVKVTETGEDLTRASMAETQSVIESRLGIDWASYSFLACFDAETWRGFVGAGERERRELTEKLLSLDSHGTFLETARKRATAAKAELQSLTDLATSKRSDAVAKRDQAVSLRALELQCAEDAARAVSEARNALDAAPTEESIESAERVRARNDALVASVAELSSRAATASAEASMARKILQDLASSRASTQSTLASWERRISEIEARDLRALAAEIETEKKSRVEEEIAVEKRDAAEKTWNEARRELANKESERLSLESEASRVERLGDGACPVCYSAVTPESRARVVAAIAEKTVVVKAEEDAARSAEHAAAITATTARETVKKLAERQRPRVSESELERLASELVSARERETVARKELADIEGPLREGENVVATLEAVAETARREAETAAAEIDKNALSREQIDRLKAMRSAAERALREAETRAASPSQFSVAIDISEKEAAEAESAAAELDERSVSAETSLWVSKFWVRGFEPAGIRAMVVSQIVSALNEEVGKWIDGCLGGDVRVEFDSSLEATVSWKSSEKESSYAQMSSGEKRRVDLATLFAFARVMQAVIGVELDYIVFDEVADKLDRDGVVGIVASLQELSRYKRIMVITHHPTLTENLSGRQELVVRKEGGVTSVHPSQSAEGP